VVPKNPLSGDSGATFGKATNVIFLWLQGGPPQHETFDPRPNAILEIRGAFKPISTNVPGIQFSELLPRTSRYADPMAVVRSLSTRDDNYDVSLDSRCCPRSLWALHAGTVRNGTVITGSCFRYSVDAIEP